MNNLGFCKQLKFCDTVFNLEQPEYKLLLGDGQVHIKAYNLFGHKLEALRVWSLSNSSNKKRTKQNYELKS